MNKFNKKVFFIVPLFLFVLTFCKKSPDNSIGNGSSDLRTNEEKAALQFYSNIQTIYSQLENCDTFEKFDEIKKEIIALKLNRRTTIEDNRSKITSDTYGSINNRFNELDALFEAKKAVFEQKITNTEFTALKNRLDVLSNEFKSNQTKTAAEKAKTTLIELQTDFNNVKSNLKVEEQNNFQNKLTAELNKVEAFLSTFNQNEKDDEENEEEDDEENEEEEDEENEEKDNNSKLTEEELDLKKIVHTAYYNKLKELGIPSFSIFFELTNPEETKEDQQKFLLKSPKKLKNLIRDYIKGLDVETLAKSEIKAFYDNPSVLVSYDDYNFDDNFKTFIEVIKGIIDRILENYSTENDISTFVKDFPVKNEDLLNEIKNAATYQDLLSKRDKIINLQNELNDMEKKYSYKPEMEETFNDLKNKIGQLNQEFEAKEKILKPKAEGNLFNKTYVTTTAEHSDIGLGKNPKDEIKKLIQQDSFAHADSDKNIKAFAVFDGHGKKGERVAQSLKTFPMLLVDRIKELKITEENLKNGETIIKEINEAFIDFDKSLFDSFKREELGGGSTALIALIFHNKLFLINLGDSRALIIKNGKIIAKTTDQTLENVDNKVINDAQGIIVEIKGKNRLFKKKIYLQQLANVKNMDYKVKGGIEIANSFGDFNYKFPEGATEYFYEKDKVLISVIPEITMFDLPDNSIDDFIILIGCDGIFNKLSDEEVLNLYISHKDQPLDQIAKNIINEIIPLKPGETNQDYKNKNEGSKTSDNLTVSITRVKLQE